MSLTQSLIDFCGTMGFTSMTWQEGVMICISFVLIYLAVKKGFEPLLLLPIAFGMLLANLPMAGLNAEPVYEIVVDPVTGQHVHQLVDAGGLLYWLYRGVKLGIYPPLIFLGVGAMTDFGPLIANPRSILLGAAAQLGIFTTFIGALLLNFIPGITFTIPEAASIGIIGGADGPTAIYLTAKLAPHLLGPIAVAAYSYMALVPLIQPPIMRALTTKEEREIVMEQLRPVSKLERIVFPIMVTTVVSLVLPSAASLVGMLMLGNLLREAATIQSGLNRLMKTASGELMNIIVIFLGTTVGATAKGEVFLSPKTLAIIALGLAAFSMGTAGGVLFGKIMCKMTGGKVNPLIGSAGVSAVPMAARVSQKVGQEANPSNFLLMHAMGPNVAGVIGSAVAAGVLLSMCNF
ncbi:sodium ion-translocating decarboxylase subunit beta [Lutispora thermophila]|uniref:Glutaconyl-CoA decarboxylase beta subunit n=1 Tax=Lutispora thermophila DSM 19022 TaxID=1122184 RepID=A0A1M6GG91_9FIRM|nr:sodium ion-translocating decarboxylase subunit beta [Lutispora thermophila]SHJ08955.1 glutaconyl-CoA decarboxylase beta subunit [Lutispora thermophila DSM 19022]